MTPAAYALAELAHLSDGNSNVAIDRLFFAVAADAMTDPHNGRPFAELFNYFESLVGPDNPALKDLRRRYASRLLKEVS